MRLTHRNYTGMVFVPGYAPKCADPPTCELMVKITNRLALYEDIFEKYSTKIIELFNNEDRKMLMEAGIIERTCG